MSIKSKSNVVVPLRPRNQVKSITTTKELPIELKILIFLQKSTSISALILIAVALLIFGLSVSIPQLWSQDYKKLKTLQRQERQLTATNETLRNQLVQQRENQHRNATYPKPDNALFLSIPQQEKETRTLEPQDVYQVQELFNDFPLGY
ncbi:hypothetical protein [Gloeocapsa sp. PCC 73106]|uniref:hypothetical protein n=1 Tax=Gloeocapsa sp. PCC 73106 TaxID=102232 RepID=UPI0002ACB275|nr:hypothetical protein [Gloeocapsa sp. PCC 73106]ELR96581.1 hypothetical protein GLO73106DRAFT_00003760 [Gloeocapsa sp. PCC 73106]